MIAQVALGRFSLFFILRQDKHFLKWTVEGSCFIAIDKVRFFFSLFFKK